MHRRFLTGVAAAASTAVALAGTTLAASPAQAATEHWFGTIEVNTYELQEWETAVLAEVTHPAKAFPLPLQSYAVGTLYDCSGRKVRSRYGHSYSQKSKATGNKWRTAVAVDLGVDAGAGPYKEWVVTVHSKGRAPVSTSIRSSKAFVFDCEDADAHGIDSTVSAPVDTVRKPVNADFSTSAEKLVAKHMKLGKVVGAKKGKVRVGDKVGIKGAGRLVKGKVRSDTCSSAIEGFHPRKKGWISGVGGHCDSRFVIGPKMRFVTGKGNLRTVSAVGKRIELSASIDLRGHTYTRVHDLGKVRKKR